jgi:hypothetical protein|tara:strand:+ start:3145 stop:3390 length:246 start_codon:yes stop_codon:yes gene_type:complete
MKRPDLDVDALMKRLAEASRLTERFDSVFRAENAMLLQKEINGNEYAVVYIGDYYYVTGAKNAERLEKTGQGEIYTRTDWE